MPLNLLNSFGKKGVSYGLFTKSADVIDTDYLSKYFVVSELSPKLTVGRNSIAINGSSLLKAGSEILIECIDSTNQNLFIEMAMTSNNAARTSPYKESTAFIFSIHVYNDIADGVGKLILYGTTFDGRSVKWTRNVTIDKTLQNVSKIRFYNRPILEVKSVQVPILNTDISNTLKTSITFTGTAHGIAVVPPKDTNIFSINRRNVDVDYRIIMDSPVITLSTPDYQAINSQMLNAVVSIIPTSIQYPLTIDSIVPAPETKSYIVSNIFNNKTFHIIDPYFYGDGHGNQVITNINTAQVSIEYPYISYNTQTSSYLQSNINGELITMQQSYADITYRNIRTFSGFLARHKIYRRSLLSSADFSIVSDEPLFINEILRDNLTQNKFYDLLGKFYNQSHINRYWFTSSNNMSLVHSPESYIDSMKVTSTSPSSLIGNDYIMVKNDSVSGNRNANYVAFDTAQFLASSGSSYDSNFMELKSNVQYVFQISLIVDKDRDELDAGMEFYLTSSVSGATKDPNFTSRYGIKLATLAANQVGSRRIFENVIFFYTPPVDLYGTLVIVPYKCQSYIKNLSFRVYGDDGFSPDVFTARIPWAISVAGETFQIKAELFDINHNLVYSDLHAVQNFDPSGSTLIPFIPSGGGGIQPGTFDFYVSGNLFVSKSIEVQYGNIVVQLGNIFVPNIGTQPRSNLISASRFVSVRGDSGFVGELVSNPVVDVGHSDQYIFVSTGSLGLNTINPSTMTANPVRTRQSIASNYQSEFGGHIYFAGDTKTTERPTGY